MSELSINILTLNCWGLKFVAKDREQRVRAIASEIAQSNYDVVALQELWVSADYEFVRNSVAKRLPFAKLFYSGALGAGLALFSRFPIIGASIRPYSLNGHPVDVAGGDWFVGKAAASIVIKHPILGETEIFNTHLFARGGEVGPEHIRAHRLVNAWEFAKLVRISAALGRYVIAAGDFNSIPTTLPMSIIREHTGFTDAWAEANGISTAPTPPRQGLSASDAISLFGVTADSPLNTYSSGKPLDSTARRFLGKRLDYIFFRQPSTPGWSGPTLNTRSCRVVFTQNVPNKSFSYSDHFGLEATIDIHASSENGETIERSESISAIPTSLSDDTLSSVIYALMGCYRKSSLRSRTELSFFVLCLIVIVILCVGSAWLPHPWINPLFIVFTVLTSWLGTTLLYAGFIYGNWERRALMNVIEELELVRNHRRQDSSNGG